MAWSQILYKVCMESMPDSGFGVLSECHHWVCQECLGDARAQGSLMRKCPICRECNAGWEPAAEPVSAPAPAPPSEPEPQDATTPLSGQAEEPQASVA